MLKHIRDVLDRRHMLVLAISFLLGVSLTFMGFTLASASDEGDVVAVINGEALTKDDFYARLEEQAGEAILGEMILEKLVLQSENTHGITVTDDEIQAEIRAIQMSFPSEEAFAAVLEQEGLTVAQLEHEIRLSIIMQKLSQLGVTVSDEEIESFFEEHKDSLDEPEQRRVRHILVDSEDEAKDIIKQLEEGADFAALAEAHSTDTGSAVRGGEIGLIAPDAPLVETFKEAAFLLEVGEISPPVESLYGWHVIRVDELIEAREASLDDADLREAIRNELLQRKARPMDDIFLELFREADIDVKWSKYKSIMAWRSE